MSTDIFPNRKDGLYGQLAPHVSGSAAPGYGGYVKDLTIGGVTVKDSLLSKANSGNTDKKVGAFIQHLVVVENSYIELSLWVDTLEVDGVSANTILGDLIGKQTDKITWKGKIGVYRTNSEKGGEEVIKDNSFEGQIRRAGTQLELYPQPLTSEGSLVLMGYLMRIVPDEKVELQTKFGTNGVWEFGPRVAK
jgi:hypothetical protein